MCTRHIYPDGWVRLADLQWLIRSYRKAMTCPHSGRVGKTQPFRFQVDYHVRTALRFRIRRYKKKGPPTSDMVTPGP